MSKHTHITYDFWLTFADDGRANGAYPRATKGEPHTGQGERAIRCKVVLPVALFATPQITMKVSVPEVVAPVFVADVQAAAEDFKRAIGMDIDMRIIPSADEAIALAKGDLA